MSNNQEAPALIELQYLPAISWIRSVAKYPVVYLDAHAHWVKSSYRNRCHILGPNGLLRLSVPLERSRNQRTTTGNVRIAYDQDWQKNHWMTLMSCYRRSAYFEYFEDMFEPLFRKKPETLFEWNMLMLEQVRKIIPMRTEFRVTEKYHDKHAAGLIDLRDKIRPGNSSDPGDLPVYNQVFSDRFDFFPDLSVIDWIFNSGKISL
ncbi:MAG: WbqC family protein [Chitinophagales bacterium]